MSGRTQIADQQGGGGGGGGLAAALKIALPDDDPSVNSGVLSSVWPLYRKSLIYMQDYSICNGYLYVLNERIYQLFLNCVFYSIADNWNIRKFQSHLIVNRLDAIENISPYWKRRLCMLCDGNRIGAFLFAR